MERNKRGGGFMEQLTIFDMMFEEYKINKPIRLIELFAR